MKEIKRSQGLSVSELCDRVGLSYMGVKQHCVAMEKEGYLDTWRRPKGMGRPEKAYRLTPFAQDFFPTEYSSFTCDILDSIYQVYGPAAPDKILFNIYRNETQKFTGRMSGDTLEERIQCLASLREESGYMSEYLFNNEKQRHEMVEYNCPILLCMDRYPILRELERQMIEKLVQARAHREEERVSGLYKCTYHFSETA